MKRSREKLADETPRAEDVFGVVVGKRNRRFANADNDQEQGGGTAKTDQLLEALQEGIEIANNGVNAGIVPDNLPIESEDVEDAQDRTAQSSPDEVVVVDDEKVSSSPVVAHDDQEVAIETGSQENDQEKADYAGMDHEIDRLMNLIFGSSFENEDKEFRDEMRDRIKDRIRHIKDEIFERKKLLKSMDVETLESEIEDIKEEITDLKHALAEDDLYKDLEASSPKDALIYLQFVKNRLSSLVEFALEKKLKLEGRHDNEIEKGRKGAEMEMESIFRAWEDDSENIRMIIGKMIERTGFFQIGNFLKFIEDGGYAKGFCQELLQQYPDLAEKMMREIKKRHAALYKFTENLLSERNKTLFSSWERESEEKRKQMKKMSIEELMKVIDDHEKSKAELDSDALRSSSEAFAKVMRSYRDNSRKRDDAIIRFAKERIRILNDIKKHKSDFEFAKAYNAERDAQEEGDGQQDLLEWSPIGIDSPQAKFFIAIAKKKGIDVSGIEKDSNKFEKMVDQVRQRIEVAVHGALRFDEKNKRDCIAPKTDLDGRSIIGLCHLVGLDVEIIVKNGKKTYPNVRFVAPGNIQSGRLNGDTGGVDGWENREGNETAIVDHHGGNSGPDTSATANLVAALRELGMFEGEEFSYIDKLVDYVNKIDNKNFPLDAESFLQCHWQRLYSLDHYLDFDDIKRWFADGYDADSLIEIEAIEAVKKEKKNPGTGKPFANVEEFKKRYGFIRDREYKKGGKQVRKMVDICLEMRDNVQDSVDKLGMIEGKNFIVDTKDYGSIIIDVRSGQNGGLIFDAARAHGYGGCLSWTPAQNSFAFSTVVDKPVAKDAKDKVSSWGVLAVRRNMLIKPRGNAEAVRPMSEVLAVLTDCDKSKFYPDRDSQPELFKALLIEDIEDDLKKKKEALRERLERAAGRKYEDDELDKVLDEIKSKILKQNGF